MPRYLFASLLLLLPAAAFASPDPKPEETEPKKAADGEQGPTTRPTEATAGQVNAARYTINSKDCPATAGDEIRDKLQAVDGIKDVRQISTFEFDVYYDPLAFELQKAVDMMKEMGYPPTPSRPIAGSVEDAALRLQSSADKVSFRPGSRGRMVVVLYPKNEAVLTDVQVVTKGTSPQVKPGRQPQSFKELEATKLKDGRQIAVFPLLIEAGTKPGVYVVKVKAIGRAGGDAVELTLDIPVTVQ